MDRTALLQALVRPDGVRHAGRLFSLLGYQPDDAPAEDGAHVVARWSGFQVIASDGAVPHDAARALAKRLAAGARPALAVACGPSDLAFATPRIGAPGITPLLIVPRAEPSALALQLLCELSPRRGDTGLAHALRVAAVLSTERAGEGFFRRFHAALERMVTSLPRQGSASDRRTAAPIALTRVLFLYFVHANRSVYHPPLSGLLFSLFLEGEGWAGPPARFLTLAPGRYAGQASRLSPRRLGSAVLR